MTSSKSVRSVNVQCLRIRNSPVALYRIPESVLVIVYTDDAEVLLLKRSAPFEFWQSVTGSLEIDELACEAAVRELFEETGLANEGQLYNADRCRNFTIDPRWRKRYAPGVTENTEHEWHFRLPAPCNVQIDDAEHSECQWVPINEAINRVWSWTNKDALRMLQAELRTTP
ncbi:MAG: dihydroneopterin triphosphate diphosphatase [Woeseiaceae bacterium]